MLGDAITYNVAQMMESKRKLSKVATILMLRKCPTLYLFEAFLYSPWHVGAKDELVLLRRPSLDLIISNTFDQL